MSGSRIIGDPDDPGRRDRATVLAALGDPLRLAIIEALVDSDLAPDAIAHELGMPTNGLAHHLRVLHDAGLVAGHPSQGDGRRRYLSLQPSRLEGLVQRPSWTVSSVLFVCTANAARSQMADALWRARSAVPSASAGHHPGPAIPQATHDTLAARGLAVQAVQPKSYATVNGQPGLVVSVCDVAREQGVPFDAPRLHWSIPDPLSSGSQADFDAAFEVIADRIDGLVDRVHPA